MQGEANKALGLWSATALVVGTIIGSGVFLLPAALAQYGGVSLIGWTITLTGALALAATLARLAMRWPQTGGPYAFARNAFGDLPGFVVAWSYWICNWTACAAIAVAFAGSLGAIFPGLVATPLRSAACALLALWFCIAINLAGMREFGRAQIVLTALKILPLLLFGGIAIWLIDGSHYRPLNPGTESLPQAINATVALTVWSLLGLETATVPAGSIEHPERTIPRATVLGTLLAGIATVLAVSAVIGIVPMAQLQVSTAPMADAAQMLWGPWAGMGIALVAAISCLGALNSSVMAAAQVALAAADDRLLPAFFARRSTRGTPASSIVLVGVLATALVCANFSKSLVELFTFVILLATAATLIPYVASSAAWLRRGQGGRLAATLALIFSLYALIGTGTEALLWCAVLLLAGLPIYYWMRRNS